MTGMVLHASAHPHSTEHGRRLKATQNIQLTDPAYNFRLSTRCQHAPCALTTRDKQGTDLTTAKAAVSSTGGCM